MKKSVLTIATIIIVYVSAFSQTATETRQIKTTALQVYENYKVVMAGLFSKSAYTKDNFLALFDNRAILYNDITPDNNPWQLTPLEYFEKFQANVLRIYPDFGEFNMNEPISRGGKWQIKCDFTGAKKYLTQNNLNYPDYPFDYSMVIEMDKTFNNTGRVYENAKIVSIDVDNPLKSFFIIENKNNIPLLSKTGEIIKGWDDEYKSRIFPSEMFKISDIKVSELKDNNNYFNFVDVKLAKSKSDEHFYRLDVQKFKKNIFGIGVSFSPGPLTFGSKMSEENAKNFKDIEKTKSDALSLSLFYGMQIANNKKSTTFLNTGLELNIYSHEYKGAYHTELDAKDSDKDPYTRIIDINHLKENAKINTISVPLGIQHLFQLTQQSKKPVFLSFEVGVFAEFAISSKSNYSMGNANYLGYYAQYFGGLTFDHYYDYSRGENLSGDNKLKTVFNSGIFGGAGLWFALDNNNLLKFNVLYKHRFNAPLKYREDYIISYDRNPDSYQSLLYSTKQAMQNLGIGITWVKAI